jgi:hypothetical protein
MPNAGAIDDFTGIGFATPALMSGWLPMIDRCDPRNDVRLQTSIPAARYARVVLEPLAPKQRAQGMPGARRARSLACKVKKHTS